MFSLILNLLLMVSFGTSFVYGLHKCLTTRKNLYFQMITAAIGCASVTRLYNCVIILCDGKSPSVFNVGLIGPISCFALIFCANYGAIDSLIDDKSKTYLKYRLISVIPPLCLAATSFYIVKTDYVDLSYKVAALRLVVIRQ